MSTSCSAMVGLAMGELLARVVGRCSPYPPAALPTESSVALPGLATRGTPPRRQPLGEPTAGRAHLVQPAGRVATLRLRTTGLLGLGHRGSVVLVRWREPRQRRHRRAGVV